MRLSFTGSSSLFDVMVPSLYFRYACCFSGERPARSPIKLDGVHDQSWVPLGIAPESGGARKRFHLPDYSCELNRSMQHHLIS
jgi:hypothetical protein